MNARLRIKLRLFFIPFLWLSIAIICAYTYLNWLLFIRLHLFLLKEEITDLFVPFGIPWIPFYFWYLPRIRLLKFRERVRNPKAGVMLLIGFATIVPLIIAQVYLSTASGKLTHLEKVRDIAQVKQTRYYTIKEYTVDRSYNASYYHKSVSGKSNQHLNLDLYIVCPIYDPEMAPPPSPFPSRHDSLVVRGIANDSAGILPDSIFTAPPQEKDTKIRTIDQDTGSYPLAWIGVKYSKQISNRLDGGTKQEKIDEFADESRKSFLAAPDKEFTYFDAIPYSDDYVRFEKAVERTPRVRRPLIRVLIAKDQPFESRNGQKLPWIFGSFAIGASFYFLFLLFTPLDDEKLKAWLEDHPGSTLNQF